MLFSLVKKKHQKVDLDPAYFIRFDVNMLQL